MVLSHNPAMDEIWISVLIVSGLSILAMQKFCLSCIFDCLQTFNLFLYTREMSRRGWASYSDLVVLSQNPAVDKLWRLLTETRQDLLSRLPNRSCYVVLHAEESQLIDNSHSSTFWEIWTGPG